MLLKGIGSIEKISVALDINWDTANKDVKAVLQNWADRHTTNLEEKLATRIEQLMFSVQAAWQSYQRSRKDQEETSTVYTPVQCPSCKGSGFMPNTETWCETCDGNGEVIKEVVTKRIKGQAGDSTFLNIYQRGIIEAAKLEGLYLERKEPSQPAVNINVADGGRLDFSAVDPEMILEAKGLLERIEAAAKGVRLGGWGQRRIEVDSQPDLK